MARISPPRELARSPLRYSDEFELVEAIKTQIDLDKDLERAKEELATRSDFNTIDSFNMFDPLRKGAIDTSDLKDVYNLHGQYPDFDELALLMKKYDTNHDRKWSYHEFVDAILPKKIDYASMVRSRIPFNSDGRYSRLTLFSSETSYLFKNVLRTWIKSEAHSESIRQRLSKRPMRVIDAFDALDKTHRGYLTELEVIHILIISSVTYLTLIASTPLVKSSNFLLIVMIPTRTAASLLESLQTKLSLNPQLDSDSIRSLL